jgi:RimJ/RimL family protein N-acetyltransferase
MQRPCRAHGRIAGANLASIRTAAKVGFVRQAEELNWIGSLT